MKHRHLTGLFALALALAMTLSLLPAAPARAEESDGGGTPEALTAEEPAAETPEETPPAEEPAAETLEEAAPAEEPAAELLEEAAPAADLPEKFDLRSFDLVSSVKRQDPWGSCWGFAATAAAEISILAEFREYAERTGDDALAAAFADPDALDLSELQLAWFASTAYPEDDADGQGGEGLTVEGTYPMNTGGSPVVAASIYSAAVGPVLEADVPYRPAEEAYYVYDADGAGYFSEEPLEDDTWVRWSYASTKSSDPTDFTDWSVDEEYRDRYLFELEDAYVLNAPAGIPGQPYDIAAAEYATRQIKEQLLQKRGVTIQFMADTFMPGQSAGEPLYLNTDTWAHYTWSDDGLSVSTNHMVCIVGWDDSYSRENFLEGHQPEYDGAWICKNSWGAAKNDSPHKGVWGLPYEDGTEGSGYFYLSYYDRSLIGAESFNFDVERFFTNSSYGIYVEQYDKMPAMMRIAQPDDKGAFQQTANVFYATGGQMVRTVGVYTGMENTEVTAELYRLNEDFSDPTDGTRVASVTKVFPLSGYHRLDFESFDASPVFFAGQAYSVVVTEKADGGAGLTLLPLSMSPSEIDLFQLVGVPAKSMYRAVVNPGESFVSVGGVWSDWSAEDGMRQELIDVYLAAGVDLQFDNFPIKAYADLFAFLAPEEAALTDEAIAEIPSFDLRRLDLVTPVKDQSPWGTCWGFAATAASEISILNSLRQYMTEHEYNEMAVYAGSEDLDLSERQLAWFAVAPIPEGSQAGEGFHVLNPARSLDKGGTSVIAASVFAAGTGPIPEDYAPYQASDGSLDPDSDWSLDEALRNLFSFELEHSVTLATTAGRDEAGEYVFNEAAALAIKRELLQGRGVSIGFCADTSEPDQLNDEPQYISENWAHYTWDGSAADHDVCVVGWDDNYPKENFREDHQQPPADGAWIVKNSWGAGWGLNGYFYLSYYDPSIDGGESFDFDFARFYEYDYSDSDAVVVDQYDLMPGSAFTVYLNATDAAESLEGEGTLSRIANVFQAWYDQELYAVSVPVPVANGSVSLSVYELGADTELLTLDDPTQGRLVASATQRYTLPGYHRITLPERVVLSRGTKYSVVAYFTGADGEVLLPLKITASYTDEEAARRDGAKAYAVAVVNPGESFLSLAGADGGETWQDYADWAVPGGNLQTWIEEQMNLTNGRTVAIDNLPIKAYARVLAFPEPDSRLSSLSLKTGDNAVAFSPVFDPDTLSYSASVSSGVRSLTLTAAADLAAEIEVLDADGNVLASGNPEVTAQIPLRTGSNVISITVSWYDTEEAPPVTYRLNISRASSGGGSSSGGSGGSGGSGSSGGSGGSGSGSASTVSVPDGNGGTVRATLTGQLASVAELNAANGTLALDFSAWKDVRTVEFSAAAAERLAGAERVSVKTAAAEVSFPQETLAGLAEQLNGRALRLRIDGAAALNSAQEAILSGKSPAAVFSLSLSAGDTAIAAFEGSVTVSVPFTPAEQTDAEKYRVYYVASDGALERMETAWENGALRFATEHFSDFAVLYEAFSDVASTAWYDDAVRAVSAKGIMVGVGDGRFDPELQVTRAQLAQTLFNLARGGAAESAGFTDVSADAWYAAAVNWCAAQGIVKGYGDGRFDPDATLTREDCATMLYRYAVSQGQGFRGAWMFLLNFPDAAEVSEYADEAMHWMVMHGILNGMDDGTLNPRGSATRAQLAAILARYTAEITET